MKKDTLRLLERLIKEKSTRENRLSELLKDPESDHEESWAMCLPTTFNDALDIKRTERIEKGTKITCWTQGSSFSFNNGDTIYDTPDAYQVFGEAIKHINLCVQIQQATSAKPREGSQGRSSGSVAFTILTPNKERTHLVTRCRHTLSQDDFVRFLIAGPDGDLAAKIYKAQEPA